MQDRHHFFALAAKAMRQLVVDHARRRAAEKRGGDVRTIALDDLQVAVNERAEEMLALDETLERLAALDETLSRVVELRYFAGLSVEETADALDCSPRTVKREWRKARAFLYPRARLAAAHNHCENRVANPRNVRKPVTSVTVVSTIEDDCAGS